MSPFVPPERNDAGRSGWRFAAATLLPFLVCIVQWLLWDPWIKPYVWFLFFPSAFFSAWLGGFRGGLAGTVIAAALVWFFYIPPQFSFSLQTPSSVGSIAMFVIMGGLFGWVFERLQEAQQRTDAALDQTRDANDRIEALYRKTVELDEVKSQFFANVSHELRTPLTLLLGPLESRLRRAVGADFSEQDRRETEMMLRNARLLYRHVSDLLDAAKLEANRTAVAWARVDLAQTVRVSASHFETLANDRGVAFSVTVPETLVVEADNEKVGRVLINLLSNAFKFTPDGGHVEVRLRAEGDMARLEVEDDGPGIPADMRHAIFERFRQVEGGNLRRYGGTGLGLAIVRDFVELHGGTVEAGLAPRGGALFSVRLPLRAPEGSRIDDTVTRPDPIIEQAAVDELRSEVALESADCETSADAPLVLVVEDNPDMNAFIAASLRPRYRVVQAFNGREGLDRAQAEPPELIVTDAMMPLMSGEQMVEALRRQPRFLDLPIIMLTAKADEAFRKRMFELGIQGYLNKPFAVEELLARVGALLAARQRVIQEIRRLNASLAAIVQWSDDAIIGKTLDSVVTSWNRGAEKIFGYTAQEMIGHPLTILFPPGLEEEEGQIVARIARGEVVNHFESRRRRKDGRIIDVSVTISPIFDDKGRVVGASKIARDITEAMQSELALRQSEERLRTILDGVDACIYLKDCDGRYLFANDAVRRLWGVELDEVVGFGDDKFFDAETVANIRHNDRRVLAGGEIVRAEETNLVVGSSAPVTYLSVKLPLRHADGTIYALCGISTDISERIRAENDIRIAMDHLSVSNAELERFAYVAAHDLQEPVRSIVSFSQLLERRLGATLSADDRESFGFVIDGARRMGTLINDLLAYSRINSQEEPFSRIALATACNEALVNLQGAIRDKDADVIVGDLPEVLGNSAQMTQLFQNLVGNAIKYSRPDVRPHIAVSARRQGAEWVVTVSDNGIGIGNTDQDVFEIFRRLHTVDAYPGTGVGLAICRRIVQRHQGRIWYESVEGQGSAFHFAIPA
ncbi:MAG: ATP-binding protein [Actinomycetota bacterium]